MANTQIFHDISKLCPVCLNLDEDRSLHNREWEPCFTYQAASLFALRFKMSDMQETAKSGCKTCSLIIQGFEVTGRENRNMITLQHYEGRIITLKSFPPEVEVGIQLGRAMRTTITKSPIRLQFYQVPGTKPHERFGFANDVAPELSVEVCASKALRWIRTCSESHELCAKRYLGTSRLPTRLLDLEQGSDLSVVLIDSDKHCDRIKRYSTLSHCWGAVQLIRTTRQVLTQHYKGIQWESLPKTFQDAIAVSRAMSIGFIWIDSLCIIQDDELDWKRESVRMASIYSNGYINIAATNASDSRGGCFSPRHVLWQFEPTSTQSHSIMLDGLHGSYEIHARPSLNSAHLRYTARSSFDVNPEELGATPLLTRAWVFQERYLAPRTLHFHPSEMVMECKSGLFCECGGLDNIPRGLSDGLTHLEDMDHDEILNHWFEAVETFTKLRLTYQSDRLPALMGIATLFQQYLKCRYLAGLWSTDLARGLLWDLTRYRRTDSHRNYRRNKPPLAPTWSWASMILDSEGAGVAFPFGSDHSFEVDWRFGYDDIDTGIPKIDTTTELEAISGAICITGATTYALLSKQSCDQLKDATLLMDYELEDFICIVTVGINLDAGLDSSEPFLQDGLEVCCLIIGTILLPLGFPNKIEEYQRSVGNRLICGVALTHSLVSAGAWERIGLLQADESIMSLDAALITSLKLV
ncbi:HET-domain-containing protein [Mollisia scopiformis]|uniref:HET-domain-containing protein n=1 Tax=Mollisia scopiformis TaxID=149040 RepID=A0A194X4F7_MOLSC|nr:HET-domain-containing protein [Mollisia scopiformis]KUJ15060.1 HET-domain-containing protein [Mollisia scopiformis]